MICGVAPCGMRYAVRRTGRLAAYCALSIACGTKDEEDFPEGIAHFAEHTLFKGTANRSASSIVNRLDSLGGELNAFTTKEEIVLHSTVLREDLRKACSLLLEIASRPTFPSKEIEVEKGVVIDEIQSAKDCPSDDIFDSFEELLFEGNSLARPILGRESSVASITREQLVAFHRRGFVPGKMALTLVADMDEQALEALVLALVGRYFPDRVESADSKSTPHGLGMLKGSLFNLSEQRGNNEVNLVMGATAPGLYSGRARYEAILLANILGGPASNSVLNKLLRERYGWVYSVDVNYAQYSESGMMAVSLGCDKSNLAKCVRAVRTQLDRLCAKPLSQKRLAAAKRQLLGQFSIASDSGEAQCLSMGKSLLSFGLIPSEDETRDIVYGLEAEALRSLAEAVFAPERLSMLVYE